VALAFHNLRRLVPEFEPDPLRSRRLPFDYSKRSNAGCGDFPALVCAFIMCASLCSAMDSDYNPSLFRFVVIAIRLTAFCFGLTIDSRDRGLAYALFSRGNRPFQGRNEAKTLNPIVPIGLVQLLKNFRGPRFQA